MRRALVLASLPLLPVALAAQGRSYHVAGNDVAIYNIAGVVTVQAGNGPDVVVEVTPVGHDAGRLTVATGEISGFQTLRVIYPEDRIVYDRLGRDSNTNFSIRDDGTWGSFDGRGRHERGDRRITIRGSGSGLEAAADLRVSIPAGKRVGVFLGVGRLDASNVSGRLRLDVASADIHAENLKGEIRLDTGSGNIEARGMDGDLSLDTGSGDVRLDGMRNGTLRIDTGSGSVTGSSVDCTDLSVDTGSGGIDLTGVSAQRVKLDAGSGDIAVALTAAPDRLRAETGSGDVRLQLPEGLGATVDLDTGSGDFTVDFPVRLLRKGESSIRGRIGDGRSEISIETGSGDITLTH